MVPIFPWPGGLGRGVKPRLGLLRFQYHMRMTTIHVTDEQHTGREATGSLPAADLRKRKEYLSRGRDTESTAQQKGPATQSLTHSAGFVRLVAFTTVSLLAKRSQDEHEPSQPSKQAKAKQTQIRICLMIPNLSDYRSLPLVSLGLHVYLSLSSLSLSHSPSIDIYPVILRVLAPRVAFAYIHSNI